MGYDSEACLLKTHIVDSGKGIKLEDQEKLFQMFGKLKRTAVMNHEGIGMGLMICQKLVTMNKGEIELRSDGLGLGVTAVFSFSAQIPEGQNNNDHDKERS